MADSHGSIAQDWVFSMCIYYLFNTYSMKQPDLYYFETIKMTSQALSN